MCVFEKAFVVPEFIWILIFHFLSLSDVYKDNFENGQKVRKEV